MKNYEFDRTSFSFKKVHRSFVNLLRNIVQVVLISACIALVTYFILSIFIRTDTEKRLARENNMYEKVYAQMQEREQLIGDAVSALQYKDNEIFAVIPVKDLIKDEQEYMLIVKLTNFNLTLLGEVNKPGMYKVYQSQINLFEAVSMAGNMTNFAKREAVKIVRQTDDGSEIITVDMGQADILSSPYYYLKPNDIIIVEPLKIKQWGFTTFPYSTVISITTLGITLFTLFNKLKQ